MPDQQELRPLLGDESPPGDAVVVVRGGPTSIDRLHEHARRTHDAYVLDGQPLRGISVFCGLDDVGAASLDSLLRRSASYRVVHLPHVAELLDSGFHLLPSFRRPHFTVRLEGDGRDHLRAPARSTQTSRIDARTMDHSGPEGGSHGQCRHHLRSDVRG